MVSGHRWNAPFLPLTVWFGEHHLGSVGWSVPSLEQRGQGLFQTWCLWGEWALGYVPTLPWPPSSHCVQICAG